MEIDGNLLTLRARAETAINTYDQFKDSTNEASHRAKTRAALESIARELKEFKSIHDRWCSDTRSLPPVQPAPIHAEMRTALRAMTAEQRDAIMDDPNSGALPAVACSCSRSASLNTNSAFGLPAIASSLSPKHSARNHQGVKQFNKLLTHHTRQQFHYTAYG
ncbi:MAG: hypothetical protein H0V34_01620 [Gammaproteobacteria bacterium]|nr:hypothetical protein [Gammaproteobacteria bacterium]